jgi:formamidopyrimidine-DNA glycosylase
MPEIVEVRKYADFITQKMYGKKVEEILILNGRYKKHGKPKGFSSLDFPFKIISVNTKGKLLYMTLDNGLYIVSTLGLSGGWCFKSTRSDKYDFPNMFEQYQNNEKLDKYLKRALNHLNIEFVTNHGSLYFFDTLSFGTLSVMDKTELSKKLQKLGPDIMDDSTNFDVFLEKVDQKPNEKIGNVLMDQTVLSGIGNYLRADVLYLSKVNPFRKVKDLSKKELERIYDNCKILTLGEYDRNLLKKKYKLPIKFLPYDYDRLFFVYMQDTDIHGNKVLKKELYKGSQKRFIYYVDHIQK